MQRVLLQTAIPATALTSAPKYLPVKTTILSRVSTVMTKHQQQKHAGKEKVNVAYTSTSQSITEGSQDMKSSRAGA